MKEGEEGGRGNETNDAEQERNCALLPRDTLPPFLPLTLFVLPLASNSGFKRGS